MTVQNSIIDFIKNKQLKWYGRVNRMTEDRFPKKSIRMGSTWKKKKKKKRKAKNHVD